MWSRSATLRSSLFGAVKTNRSNRLRLVGQLEMATAGRHWPVGGPEIVAAGVRNRSGDSLVVGEDPHTGRRREPRGEAEQLVDADRRAPQRTDAAQIVQTRGPEIHLRALRIRHVSTTQIAVGELHIFEPRRAEVGAPTVRRCEAHLGEARQPEVRLLEAAVGRGHAVPGGATEVGTTATAVDEGHAVQRRFGEVAAREVAAHELDVDEAHPLIGGAGDARPAPSDADAFAALVEIEVADLVHAAILAPDVVTRHP